MQSHEVELKDRLIHTFLYYANLCKFENKVICKDEFKTTELYYHNFEKSVRKIAYALKETYPNILPPQNSEPVLVGVKCRSKLQTLISEFAILALGGTFVPLSFNEPEALQLYKIQESGVSLILTDHSISKSQQKTGLFCDITKFKPSIFFISEQEIYVQAKNDLAYVLFTSGSTREHPLGVMRTRSGLYLQMTRNYRNDLNISDKSVLLNLAVMTHDQAIVDCFGALLNGAAICLYDPHDLNVDDLHQFMRKYAVSIYSSTPHIFSIVFDHIPYKDYFPRLKVVTTGGEETLIEHVALYQKSCPDECDFFNGYGLTEDSWIASEKITKQTDLTQYHAIPFGQATESMITRLVECREEEDDEESEKVYELCVSSDTLSPGYFHNDEETNIAFFYRKWPSILSNR